MGGRGCRPPPPRITSDRRLTSVSWGMANGREGVASSIQKSCVRERGADDHAGSTGRALPPPQHPGAQCMAAAPARPVAPNKNMCEHEK